MSALDAALIAAHAAADLAELVHLYTCAAEEAKTRQDADAAAFYLTHAHVFALEVGHPAADSLRAQLVEFGREVPLHPPAPPKR